MKVQTKILILITCITLFVIALIYLIQLTETEKTIELLEEKKSESLESLETSVESIGKTLEVFSTDYTQWDEMVEFARNPDKSWALENIEYPIITFSVNAAWLFNEKLEQVYDVNNLEDSTLRKFPLNDNDLRRLLDKNYFNHFFIKLSNRVFEIRSAPLQPTYDVERKTKPQGCFFVGRYWSDEMIKDLEIHTTSKIEILDVSDKSKYEEENEYEVSVFKTLYDWQSRPIIRLVSTSEFTFLKKSQETFGIQMIIGATLSISILVIVGVFLFLQVNKPMKKIIRSLEKGNTSLLIDISKTKNEFGKLADLIIQFFNQEEKLIQEERQRVIAEYSLSKSEEKYKKIFDNVQDVFFQTDLTGIIVSVSPSIERYSGYRQDEVMGKNIMDYYLDTEVRTKFLEEIKLKGEVTDFEIYFVKKSGRAIPCSVNAHFLYSENKKVMGIEGSLRDISERKRNEELILKLSRVVEQSPVSIVITDVAGNIEYVNTKFAETSGYLIEEVIGKDVSILKSGLMPKVIYKDLWATISSGKEWIGELQNMKKNGELFWENVFISPIINPENRLVTNYVAIKEDISDKKRIVEELRNAKEKAEEMNNLKSSFLANMSHELRTPMMGILGNAEIISISTEDEEIKEMATAIFSSGKRLINTLNIILDLSRL